jgi:hypothetical protein
MHSIYDGLTPREREILRQLLAKRGITKYEILGVTPEGKDLPGSTYDGEIELLSGVVVTATNTYDFWLDWVGGNYTFSIWREVDLKKARDKDEILAAQQRVRQRGTF